MSELWAVRSSSSRPAGMRLASQLCKLVPRAARALLPLVGLHAPSTSECTSLKERSVVRARRRLVPKWLSHDPDGEALGWRGDDEPAALGLDLVEGYRGVLSEGVVGCRVRCHHA